MLEETDFSTDDTEANSQELFDAAVNHVAEARIKPLNAQIKTLQESINALAKEPEDDPTAQAVARTNGKKAFGVNMKAAFNRIATSYLSTGYMPEITAQTIDVTELTSELGTYLSQGNNLELLSELYHAFTTSKHLNWKRAVTEYKAVQSHITSVVQRFKPEWNPKGESNFTVLTVKNYRLKVNFPIVAAEVGESWLFHLYDEKKTPQEMPITRYIVQNVLMPSIVNDIELKMIGKGKYDDKKDTAEASMDGFETILVNARTSLDKGIRFFNTDVNLRTATDAPSSGNHRRFRRFHSSVVSRYQDATLLLARGLHEIQTRVQSQMGCGQRNGKDPIRGRHDRFLELPSRSARIDVRVADRVFHTYGKLRRPATQESAPIHHRYSETGLYAEIFL